MHSLRVFASPSLAQSFHISIYREYGENGECAEGYTVCLKNHRFVASRKRKVKKSSAKIKLDSFREAWPSPHILLPSHSPHCCSSSSRCLLRVHARKNVCCYSRAQQNWKNCVQQTLLYLNKISHFAWRCCWADVASP